MTLSSILISLLLPGLLVGGQSLIDKISIRTPLAAVNDGAHLRIYETAVDGSIHEARYEGTWSGGTSGDVIATGKPYSPVSATSLGLGKIGVYYIGDDNIVREECYDENSGWYTGALSAMNI